MKNLVCLLFFLGLYTNTYGADGDIVRFSIEKWFSCGDISLKASFDDYHGNPAISEHKFNNINIPTTTMKIDIDISPDFSIGGLLGIGYINSEVVVHDITMFPKTTREMDIFGGTLSTELDICYKVMSWSDDSYIKGVIVYKYDYEEFNVVDGRFRASGFPGWFPIYLYFPIGHEFNKYAMFLGTKIKTPSVHDISLIGAMSIGYSFMDGNNALPSTLEEFVADGYVFAGDIGLKYQSIKTVSMEAGYKFHSFKSESGQGTIQDYWGMESNADYEIESFFHGPYISLSGSF